MQVLQQNSFKRAYKKLHPAQKQAVNEAVLAVCVNPTLGEQKKGDLAGIFVYKFSHNTQLYVGLHFRPSNTDLDIAGYARELLSRA